MSLMPPDAPTPTGGYTVPALGKDGLRIGDTVGATPGAYGFIVSCNLQGYVGTADVVQSGFLQVTVSSIQNINPLDTNWTSDAGPGPAKLQYDMVRGKVCRGGGVRVGCGVLWHTAVCVCLCVCCSGEDRYLCMRVCWWLMNTRAYVCVCVRPGTLDDRHTWKRWTTSHQPNCPLQQATWCKASGPG